MANVLLGIHCVVPGCMSTLRRVNQWKSKTCLKPKHKGKLHSQCMCPEPYQFFKFPAEVKLQKLWLERVKRPDLEVNNLTRVCSLHFVEGRPTRRHYFPNINIHQEDEADLEDETEEQLYFDDQGEEDLTIEEAVASPPAKKGRSGTVSIVPMELLQEQGGEDGGGEHAEEEEYEGDLTISRFNYHGSEEGVYEMPTNSVTITRVTSIPAGVCTKPSNRFINTKKPRVDSAPSGNRFLKDRGTSASGSSLTNVQKNTRPQQPAVTPLQSRPSSLTSTKINPLRATGMRNKVQQTRQEEDNCPYEIDMLVDEGDEDDGDSSDLSDIGIDIQPTAALKRKYTNKDISTAKTLSSLVRQHVSHTSVAPPPKELVSKPKLIPVLAVAPKSQHQLPQQILQPVQAIPRATNLIIQQNKKPSNSANNVLVATTQSKPAIATSGTSHGIPPKTVVAVAGSSSVKIEPSTVPTPPISSATTLSSTTPVNGDQQTPAAPTLATYDPTKQQLQIANPVKYIQECHARIAQLLSEKQQVEARNIELEAKVQELQKSNNDLRREIVHQALNAARRTPPQLNTPTFNLVPTAIMEANASPTESQNGHGPSESTVPAGNGNKTRIRYVIRRPANVPSGNNSTN